MTASISRLPRISVVVPSYNQGHFLPEALDSIFRQNYPHLEVVVMDGGSTDDSVRIIRSYADRLKHWQSEKDGGQSAAINAGMKHCSGDLIAWLNSDDWYWHDALWTVGRAFAAHPGRGLYIGNGFRHDQRTGKRTAFCPRHVALNREALIRGTDFILQPSVFFLREAWAAVGGLEPGLGFCMDWDVFIRIAARYQAVVINDFLGVSREYEETKTRSGKMKRAFEIVRMIQKHTGIEVTPGSVIYLLQTLIELTQDGVPAAVPDHLRKGMRLVARQLGQTYGGGHGFPELSDPQDSVYLPSATADAPPLPIVAGSLPTISVVVPILDRGQFLDRTLASLQHQDYPGIEPVVLAGGDNPAQTINEGLARAGGEILGWVNAGDELSVGALREVGQLFAEDSHLDLVYGNAVLINEAGGLHLGDQGHYRSGFLFGEFQPPGSPPAYGSEVYCVPPSTVFFRRRLLERCGPLAESYRHIHGYELFTRFARQGKVRKLERTQALCRVLVTDQGERWHQTLTELYDLTRPQWPGCLSRRFSGVVREYVAGYMRRKFPCQPHNLRFWRAVVLVACAAAFRWGNPERWWRKRYYPPRQYAPPFRLPALAFPYRRENHPPLFIPERRDGRPYFLVSTATLPHSPGSSSHEAREYRLLHHLHEAGTVEVFTHERATGEQGIGVPATVTICHTPEKIEKKRPELTAPVAQKGTTFSWLSTWLRRLGLPVPGPRYPVHITDLLRRVRTYCWRPVQAAIDQAGADFVIISSQDNPLALTLDVQRTRTRLILLVHEGELEAMQHFPDRRRGLLSTARRWEQERARDYERDTLACFDGILAGTERERRYYIETHSFAPERVLLFPTEGKAERRLSDWFAELAQLPRRTTQALTAPAPPASQAA